MKNGRWKTGILLLALMSAPVRADDEKPAEEKRKDESQSEWMNKLERGLRVGIGYQKLTSSRFVGEAVDGIGFFGVYEIAVVPRFIIGVNLAYRRYGTPDLTSNVYPGSASGGMSQVGYGLMLKHYFTSEPNAPGKTFSPYTEYGLLHNVTQLKGVSGSGSGHDTRLGFGTDIQIGKLPLLFFDAAYHFSYLQYFNSPTHSLDYLDLGMGMRFRW